MSDDRQEARELAKRLPDVYANRVPTDEEYGPGWIGAVPGDTSVPGDVGVPGDAPAADLLALWFGKPIPMAIGESKIVRLFRVVGAEIGAIRSALNTIGKYRDVDQATGSTLDRIGRNVRQWRGSLSDETYRILIKGKIARNLSRGDINSVKTVLAVTLGVSPSDITVDELWKADSPEAAAVMIATDITAMARANLTPEQFGEIAQTVVAAGVRVQALFEGTFEFAAGPDEYDNDAGFADDLQTVGGTLGAWYDPGDSPPLPLE